MSFSSLGLFEVLVRTVTGQGHTTPISIQMQSFRAPGQSSRAAGPDVSPTRDLALQVEASLRAHGKYANRDSMSIFVGFGPQLAQ